MLLAACASHIYADQARDYTNIARVWEQLSLEFKALHPTLPKHKLTVRAFASPLASPRTVAHELVLQ